MNKIKVLTLVGGISRESINKKLFFAIRDLGLEDFEFITFDITKLPYFSQDLEMDPPDQVTAYKELIREAGAVLFITPEYNRSVPGVLKNAIDWGSRPYGMNLWDKKPAAVLGASVGNVGTFGAQHHLRQVLAYLNMYTLGQPEFYFNATGAFDEEGNLINPKTEHLLIKFFEAFTELINLCQGPKSAENQARFKSQGLEDSPAAH
jgi:chromate reductase, NAD(P)H dehydrogenase (quinone)